MSDTAQPSLARSLLREAIAGGFGGACLVLVGHPFDTVKVMLQTSTRYTGVIDCVSQTIKAQGPLGLYRGMTAPLVGVTPIFALSFFGYDMGCKMQTPAGPNGSLSLLQYGIGGAVSGVFSTAIMGPGERIKCLLQTQDPLKPKYNGMVDCIKQTARESGVRGLFTGTCATLLRDVPASFTYFITYEYLKTQFIDEKTGKISTPSTLLAGGLAGVTNWLVGLPADTLKSRVQTAAPGVYPRGVRDAFATLIRTEGPTALYRGLLPVLLRAFPANAACFWGVETARSFMDRVGF